MRAVEKMPQNTVTPDQFSTEIQTNPAAGRTSAERIPVPAKKSGSMDDGTRPLLQAGFWITLAAVIALIATKTLLGGIGIDGPHTDTGWLAFMFALMGIPFGMMLLALGGAKWLRNRRRHP